MGNGSQVMSILISILLLVVGLAIVIKSSDWLVDGASSIALGLKIAPIVVGLTVVAFGTSAPELVVSLLSASSGSTEIALGNVLGSNILNILLILGLSAVIAPLRVHANTAWKEIPFSFMGAILVAILGLQQIIDGNGFGSLQINTSDQMGLLTLSNGLVLLLFFVIFLVYTFGIAKVTGSQEGEDLTVFPLPKSILLVVLGLVGLGLGSKITVDNAVLLATAAGISQGLVGLTLVALGTSLPELVTSLNAARKGNSDIAVGNVVGSNIFNTFFILGSTLLIAPIPLTGKDIQDIAVFLMTTSVLFALVFIFHKYKLGKGEGSLMLIMYLVYLTFIIWRG